MRILKQPACEDPIWSPTSDEELLQRTIKVMTANNVHGALSGTPELIDSWVAADPGRARATQYNGTRVKGP